MGRPGAALGRRFVVVALDEVIGDLVVCALVLLAQGSRAPAGGPLGVDAQQAVAEVLQLDVGRSLALGEERIGRSLGVCRECRRTLLGHSKGRGSRPPADRPGVPIRHLEERVVVDRLHQVGDGVDGGAIAIHGGPLTELAETLARGEDVESRDRVPHLEDPLTIVALLRVGVAELVVRRDDRIMPPGGVLSPGLLAYGRLLSLDHPAPADCCGSGHHQHQGQADSGRIPDILERLEVGIPSLGIVQDVRRGPCVGEGKEQGHSQGSDDSHMPGSNALPQPLPRTAP
mmetsp:Transcript_69397/g.219622  ORF Transcript_69397/g.219622 Transcript_69397/m.219622 type:complete len:287 (-) Transcript_69397:106-966(-)